MSGDDVYVAGYFSQAGEVSANNIAKWDGTAWSALGDGVSSIVYAMAVSGTWERCIRGGNLRHGGRQTFARLRSVAYPARG